MPLFLRSDEERERPSGASHGIDCTESARVESGRQPIGARRRRYPFKSRRLTRLDADGNVARRYYLVPDEQLHGEVGHASRPAVVHGNMDDYPLFRYWATWLGGDQAHRQ
jgi:hypothetical protein